MRRSLLAALLGATARADTALDVQILQTASSLESLAVAVYDTILGRQLPETLAGFVRETRRQHDEHRKAFQARTLALDPNARAQDAPNPTFLPLLTGAASPSASRTTPARPTSKRSRRCEAPT